MLFVVQSLKSGSFLTHYTMSVEGALIGISVVDCGEHMGVADRKRIWCKPDDGALMEITVSVGNKTDNRWRAYVPYLLCSDSCDVGMCVAHRA